MQFTRADLMVNVLPSIATEDKAAGLIDAPAPHRIAQLSIEEICDGTWSIGGTSLNREPNACR